MLPLVTAATRYPWAISTKFTAMVPTTAMASSQ
jgi:hypothetical protein